MKNQETAPRTLEVLVQEFRNSVGNFTTFNRSMNSKERNMFKGWLSQLRTNPQV